MILIVIIVVLIVVIIVVLIVPEFIHYTSAPNGGPSDTTTVYYCGSCSRADHGLRRGRAALFDVHASHASFPYVIISLLVFLFFVLSC